MHGKWRADYCCDPGKTSSQDGTYAVHCKDIEVIAPNWHESVAKYEKRWYGKTEKV